MSRENAIDDLLARLAAAAGAANDLGFDLAAYLLKVAMLEIATGPLQAGGCELRLPVLEWIPICRH